MFSSNNRVKNVGVISSFASGQKLNTYFNYFQCMRTIKSGSANDP